MRSLKQRRARSEASRDDESPAAQDTDLPVEVSDELVAAGLAIGPLLTGFGVQRAGFAPAMAIAAVVLAVLGGAALVRLPARPAADRDATARKDGAHA